MSLISKEDIERAREMDLLTYLTYHEPGNLKHVSGDVYCTREHDSLIINNGKWCWFSQGIGGKGALDYLINVKGLPFRDAVERINGSITEPLPVVRRIETPPKEFVMPEVNAEPVHVIRYLKNRGIDPEIIKWCIDHKLIFETAKYNSALFVGYDAYGTPKYGAIRSTNGDFKGDAKGSDKRYSFKMLNISNIGTVHVFESVPDLLSYATLVKMAGGNWREESYLSLAGIGGNALPKALVQLLSDYPLISRIYLHLDNDEPGRNAAKNILEQLEDRYVVKDIPPPSGKDYNDYLKSQLSKHNKTKAVR